MLWKKKIPLLRFEIQALIATPKKLFQKLNNLWIFSLLVQECYKIARDISRRYSQ